jgi:hypothetical protein
VAQGAKKIGDLLGQALKKNGLERGLKRGKALLLWPEIAGPALSEWTEPERLEDGVLFIKTRDAVVNHQLIYMREEFIRRYAQKMPNAVREIRFQVGELFPKTKSSITPEPFPKLSSEEESQVHQLASQVSQDLQGVVARAAQAVKQRQKVNLHPPCVVCGTPDAQNPCPSCQRLLTEATVLNEAKRLLRNPLKSRLEGEPLSAARYIAQGKLESQMRELLPEVVQHSELFPVLQDTARRYLQLRTGEKNVSSYRNLLPETLRSLLKEL